MTARTRGFRGTKRRGDKAFLRGMNMDTKEWAEGVRMGNNFMVVETTTESSSAVFEGLCCCALSFEDEDDDSSRGKLPHGLTVLTFMGDDFDGFSNIAAFLTDCRMSTVQ